MATEKRLIDANALLLKLKKNHDLFIDAWEGFSNLPEKDKARVDEISNCIVDVFNAPTVDAVEVVHGRWEVIEVSDELYKCSACGEWQFIPEEHFAYCPYCGAKMDGDGDG